MTMVEISGNTYPVKDQIRALGGRWNPAKKVWSVPADKADAAWALVGGTAGAPAGTLVGIVPVSPGNNGYRRSYAAKYPRTGCRCGSREGITRDSDCASCVHDA
ncbi:MAG TPA: hypothetical protein VK524_18400 [Polyangiaceae bacterium]|nr:hypothetical protein [Polyangiaceae bacterium]